ncbi:MAG TPA: hypothetical protein PKG56_00205 [Chitinophagaceae bacterium]|nr:hypothetical protein [Chitinophagaceae bacterium]
MSRAKYTVDLSPVIYLYRYMNGDEELNWQKVGTFTICKQALIEHLENTLEKAKKLTEKDILL